MLQSGPDIYELADEAASFIIAAQKRKSRAKRLETAGPSVLVVDDQKMIADTTAEVLKKFGFHAVRAYNGKAALEIAAKIKPDYLLTDVLMPEMNGVELAIAITKQFPATRILLFSGQAGISDILRQAQDEGYVFELLAKPIHPQKLVEHLKRQP
jgi:CheY-like chemotaxis protein